MKPLYLAEQIQAAQTPHSIFLYFSFPASDVIICLHTHYVLLFLVAEGQREDSQPTQCRHYRTSPSV